MSKRGISGTYSNKYMIRRKELNKYMIRRKELSKVNITVMYCRIAGGEGYGRKYIILNNKLAPSGNLEYGPVKVVLNIKYNLRRGKNTNLLESLW